jgi:hypothetical protein
MSKFTDVGFGPFIDIFSAQAPSILMYQNEGGDMAHVSNINVRHRLTQIMVLLAVILACMLLSQVTQARPKPSHFDRSKYRVCVHSNSFKVVKVLYWKRKFGPKSSGTMMASSGRRTKKQALAETEY